MHILVVGNNDCCYRQHSRLFYWFYTVGRVTKHLVYSKNELKMSVTVFRQIKDDQVILFSLVMVLDIK